MATWVAIENDILRHSKTSNLKRILGLKKKRDAVGVVLSLFIFTLDHAWEDGNLEPHGAEAIADACEWDDDPQTLVEALRECGGYKDGVKQKGFLDGWVVNNWVRRASKLIRDRLSRKAHREARLDGNTRISEETMTLWNDFAKRHGLEEITDIEFKGKVNMGKAKLEQILKAAEEQPFLFGLDEDSWKMDFKWLLSPTNQNKVLGLKYLRNGSAVPKDDWSERSSKLLKARKSKLG